jgi:hypothetical protein
MKFVPNMKQVVISIHATRAVSCYRFEMDPLKTLHHWLVSVAIHCPIPSSQQEMHCCFQPQAQHITPTWISHILPLIKVFIVHMHSTMKVYGWHGNEAPRFTNIKILSNRTELFKPALKKYLLQQSFYSLEEYFSYSS